MEPPSQAPGTIIIQQQQQQGGDGSPWPWLFGLLAPFLGFMLFAIGYAAVDDPDPDTAAAGTAYGLAILLGIGAIVGPLLRPEHRFTFAGALPFAVLFGWFVGDVFDGAYGDAGFGFSVLHMMFIGPGLLIAYGIGALVGGLTRGGPGVMWSVQMVGTGTAAGYAVAASYHLATLDRQAEAARAAYDTPGVGVVLVLAVLLAGVVWRRVK